MSNNTIFEKVSELITEGELEQAIDALREYLKSQAAQDKELYHQAIALDGELKEWSEQQRQGLDPAKATYNRIRVNVLELASEAEQPVSARGTNAPDPVPITNDDEAKWLLYSILALIVLGIGVTTYKYLTPEMGGGITEDKREIPRQEKTTPVQETTSASKKRNIPADYNNDKDFTPKGKNKRATDAADFTINSKGRRQFFGNSIWASDNEDWGDIKFSTMGTYATWKTGTIKFFNDAKPNYFHGKVVNYRGENTEFWMRTINKDKLEVAIGSPNATPQIWRRKQS